MHQPRETLIDQDMRDLAPAIYRQRLVIEGCPAAPIDDGMIRRFLSELSDVCGMHRLIEPVTHHSDNYGWAGWVHWDSSGAHFYAWERPVLFFSVDIYTCAPFDIEAAVECTRAFFGADKIVARAF
jgi:S-adenosylmethionine decarboxylase